MLKLKLLQQLGNLTLNVNLDLPNKGITAIFGRSGAGKSSLINLIAGLSTAQAGFIELNGQVLFDGKTASIYHLKNATLAMCFKSIAFSLIIRWKKT